MMMNSTAARASGEVGSKPFGTALSGEDLIVLDLDADTCSSRSETLGYWNSTPIEPTSEVCWATM